jgi:hypothetical protein
VTKRQILAVEFGDDGKVADVRKYGIEDGQVIALVDRETQSRGQEMNFLQQLFGNMGGVPAAAAAQKSGPGRPARRRRRDQSCTQPAPIPVTKATKKGPRQRGPFMLRPALAPAAWLRGEPARPAAAAPRCSMILIIGFTAGPAVSLYGSPTVSPVTAALWASEPLPP